MSAFGMLRSQQLIFVRYGVRMADTIPDPVAYSQPSPPGRGQGDAPKARGSEWYLNIS